MKELKFGLIGAGRFGKNYIRIIRKVKGAKLGGVAVKTSETKKFLENFLPKKTFTTTNSSKIFENDGIDCVVIATPPSTHFELTKNALQSGKHVLLEKPMVTELAEAKKLEKFVKRSGLTFMVAHQYIYNDYINYLKSKIEKNFLGKIEFVFAQHLYPGPIRNDAGCFLDAGTHQLAVLNHLFKPGKIKKVSGNILDLNNDKIDDFVNVVITFKSGLRANLVVSSLSQKKVRDYTFFGAKKTAVFDDSLKKNKLKFFWDSVSFSPKIKEKEPLLNELNHFVYSIKNKTIPKTYFENSFKISQWLEQISKKLT